MSAQWIDESETPLQTQSSPSWYEALLSLCGDSLLYCLTPWCGLAIALDQPAGINDQQQDFLHEKLRQHFRKTVNRIKKAFDLLCTEKLSKERVSKLSDSEYGAHSFELLTSPVVRFAKQVRPAVLEFSKSNLFRKNPDSNIVTKMTEAIKNRLAEPAAPAESAEPARKRRRRSNADAAGPSHRQRGGESADHDQGDPHEDDPDAMMDEAVVDRDQSLEDEDGDIHVSDVPSDEDATQHATD